MNTWHVFNLDLNRESVSEPRTLSGRLFQSLGAIGAGAFNLFYTTDCLCLGIILADQLEIHRC